jgi:hypothetical protein
MPKDEPTTVYECAHSIITLFEHVSGQEATEFTRTQIWINVEAAYNLGKKNA